MLTYHPDHTCFEFAGEQVDLAVIHRGEGNYTMALRFHDYDDPKYYPLIGQLEIVFNARRGHFMNSIQFDFMPDELEDFLQSEHGFTPEVVDQILWDFSIF